MTENTKLLERATEVFGSHDRALIWLSRPRRALGGQTPLECAETKEGEEEVLHLLGRIEHGVFS